jgi:peptidoglycan/xylan/chitin deacetylase (PgdA/CDA1 family)
VPGVYTVSAAVRGTGAGTYQATPPRQSIRVTKGHTRRVRVTYRLTPNTPPGPSEGRPPADTPLAGVTEPEAVISLTFDDGWRSQYTNAIPLLDRYGFRSTQYIHTGGLREPEHVTEAMIRSMHAGGHQIAAHSVTHSHLTTLNPTQLQSELVDSRQTLEAIIGAPVVDFATPYGDYNPAVLAAVSKIFRTHRTASSGDNTTTRFNPSYIRTRTILRTTTVADVEQWVQAAKQAHQWLVLAYHQVGDDPTVPYGTTTEKLDAHLAAIRDSGVRVATVDKVVSEISSQPGAVSPWIARDTLAVELAQGPQTPNGYSYAITLRGFPPGANVTVACHSPIASPGLGTFTLVADVAGGAFAPSICPSGGGVDHWVVADGVTSNRVAW